MTALTPPPIVITSNSGKPLNDIFDFMVDSGLIDQDIISEVEIQEGRSSLLGDGKAPIERIEVHVNDQIYKLENHIELRKKLAEIVKIHGDSTLDDAEIITFLEH